MSTTGELENDTSKMVKRIRQQYQCFLPTNEERKVNTPSYFSKETISTLFIRGHA